MRENLSGLSPKGRAVLVEPYEPEIKQGMIVLPATVGERTRMVETRAVVVAIGPEAWKGEAAPRAKPGDKVMIVQFAGAMVVGPKDSRQYRVVNDMDIFLGLDDE